jgi:alkylhydroperoxidase family enzyme
VRGTVATKEDELFAHQPQAGGQLTEREALAVQLAERMALDPHTVDDEFFARLQEEFTDDEIVEMVYACSIFNWGNKFNITLHMDSDGSSEYEHGMVYRQEALT